MINSSRIGLLFYFFQILIDFEIKYGQKKANALKNFWQLYSAGLEEILTLYGSNANILTVYANILCYCFKSELKIYFIIKCSFNKLKAETKQKATIIYIEYIIIMIRTFISLCTFFYLQIVGNYKSFLSNRFFFQRFLIG